MSNDDPVALIERAETSLYQDDDPAACIELCERVRAMLDDDDSRGDVLVLEVEAELARDGDTRARELLAQLDSLAITDPSLLCDAGQLWWALEEDAAAERAFQKALTEDDTLADAHHGIGLLCEGRDDHKGMVAAWLKTRELDLAEPLPELHLERDEFARVAEEAVAELSSEVRERLENVPILVEDLPSAELIEEGLDPRLLGLFAGTPLGEKTHGDGGAPQLDTIHLFQLNLERASDDREHLLEEIRITVLHETAHFFGLEDDDLEEMGLG